MSKAESLEISQEKPVTVRGAYKVNYYHTTRCQFVRNAKYPGKISHTDESEIEWHDLEKCDDCIRKEKEGPWKTFKYRKLEKIAWDVGISKVDSYDRLGLIEELNKRGVSPDDY